MDKEKLKKVLEKAASILVGIAILGGIAYYVVNHNEYSTKTMAEDAKELVDKIMKQSSLPYKCVEIKNLPDSTLAMAPEYELIAVLDNGEELPIVFSRKRKDGKAYHEVRVVSAQGNNDGQLHVETPKQPDKDRGLPPAVIKKIEAMYKEETDQTTEFVKLHECSGFDGTYFVEAVIRRGGKRYLASLITVKMVDGEPVITINPYADKEF